MEIALYMATIGFFCVACFILGAKVGQKVAKGEEIETPTLNPMKAYREHEAKTKAEMEQNRIDAIMRNIENYDGTANHQEDVPRG